MAKEDVAGQKFKQIKHCTYKAPTSPALTSIPHEKINTSSCYITITYHDIKEINPFEFSRYKKLKWLRLKQLSLHDYSIDPTAFCGTILTQLSITNQHITRVPKAILAVKDTLKNLFLDHNNDLSHLKTLMMTSNTLQRIYLTETKVYEALASLAPVMCRPDAPNYDIKFLSVSR